MGYKPRAERAYTFMEMSSVFLKYLITLRKEQVVNRQFYELDRT